MVLFIGDGMATSMISAARYVSKKSTFGKFGDNLLEIEKLGTIGKVMTNGIDAMITDSANSAAAYNSGHKGWVNALNVYVDTSDDGLDDPKVETIGEYIRRTRPGMCIGVVTTTDIQDATPAAVYAHTRKRGQFDVITDQLINPFKPTSGNMTWDPKPARPDVILGGGGSSFCIKSDSKPSCQGTTTNYYDLFAKAGYQVVNNKDQLAAVKDDAPVLGIFNSNNMNYWLDRHVFTDNVKSSGNPDGSGTGATNQPDLEQMAMTAVKVMSKKCNDGFFLMVEGGLIDVGMHNMDYDRGLSELLELDRTVAAVNKWAKENGDNTGMMVTADHAHAYDVYASIDTQYFNSLPNDDKNILGDADRGLQIQKHLAIGEYAEAGWVDSVMDENGLPTKWNGRYRLASGKVDGPQLRENWQVRTSPRSAATQDRSLANKIPGAPTVMVANPAEPAGINRGSMVTPGNYRSVHSLQGVDLYCGGPWYFRRNCARVIDNTEVFFIMADALGLGYSPSNPKTRDC
ncbi:alkaline-phosphatase-like protein [Entophlyctis helioformis]|nr:alkaline-phosphatase-like protein [Entophlyctis helioformis]